MTHAHILGTGLVSGLGAGVDASFDQLLAGNVGRTPITRFSPEPYSQQQAGQLPPDLEEELLERFSDDDLTWGLIMKAAEEALGSLDALQPDPDMGLVLATNFGIMETLCWAWQERLDTGDMDEPTFRAQQDVLSTIARQTGAGGPHVQVSLSCASGAAALHVALEWLRSRRVSRVLAIGYDVLSEFTWCGLHNLRTITEDCLRPFDANRQGTIFGEGAAAMLLSTRPADADRAKGYLHGAATNNNAFHLTAPNKEAEGSRLVMQAALADAGCDPRRIDVVSAHATGTTANDLTESQALHNLLPHSPPVLALKGNLCHLMGAAGLAEAVLALQALRSQKLPPIAGLQEQDPDCAVDAVKDQPRRLPAKLALTNSAGLGGNNSSVVVGREPPKEPADHTADRGVACTHVGWVLPTRIGDAAALPEDLDAGDLMSILQPLSDFSVKPYIESVKGYLDPAAEYALAAAQLALRGIDTQPEDSRRIAIVGVTQYGAPSSAYRFYELMQSKGPRFASPLIFPHGYANTAANLVAIEHGFNGPHMVFNANPDAAEASLWARHLIQADLADLVLLIASEAVTPQVIPDAYRVLNGAICWCLQPAPLDTTWPALPVMSQNRHGTLFSTLEPA